MKMTHGNSNLHLGDAVAAIITVGVGRYLLQHRDDMPQIWYPGHWGCFGGAVQDGEDPREALLRELKEEIEFVPMHMTYFTRFDFDLDPIGLRRYYRMYYVIDITMAERKRLVLHEGDGLEVFDARTVFEKLIVTPYDAFALFLFHYQMRLTDDGVKETTQSEKKSGVFEDRGRG